MNRQLDLLGEAQRRDATGCVTPSWHAWTRFQNACAREFRRAVHHHAKRSHITAMQRQAVHDALSAGRKA